MESATRLESTFKSGDTITYREGEWDDYGYDGKAISVKLKGAWIVTAVWQIVEIRDNLILHLVSVACHSRQQ